MKKQRRAKKEVPIVPEKPKHPGGRKSLVQGYLEKNEQFRQTLIANNEKIALEPDLTSQPIETLEDLFLYMQFELQRSRDTDVLRGNTLTNYSKEFVNVFKAIEQSKALEADIRIKIETARRNRLEVEEFMKFAIEAIAIKIQDLNLRKEISQEIKNLYEKRYSADTKSITDTPGDSTPTPSI